MWLSSGQWDVSRGDMYIFGEALLFFELLTTSCWLKCGCDYCSLGSIVDWRWWNHEIEGARVPALWNAMPALDCPLLDFFCVRETNTSILFPSLLVWISSLAAFQSLVAFIPVQLNTYNYDPIYVKKSKQTYICVPDGWFWLWYRNPKVICFNTEDVLSYITSPEVGQLQGWLIRWLDSITKDSGTSHLSALPSSD